MRDCKMKTNCRRDNCVAFSTTFGFPTVTACDLGCGSCNHRDGAWAGVAAQKRTIAVGPRVALRARYQAFGYANYAISIGTIEGGVAWDNW